MRELSLFTGAGGGLLGTHLLGWRPIGYVEYNDYCQRIIRQRIDDGILPVAPIFGDIRAFISDGYATSYTGLVDVITAGFPCQPFSIAGKRLGADDDRNMWPQTMECIRLVRPEYALLENVPDLITSGYFSTILGDLAAAGYDAQWDVFSACAFGAPHTRERLFIVANANSERSTGGIVRKNSGSLSVRTKTKEWAQHNVESWGSPQVQIWDTKETDILRVVDGVGAKVDRLRAIGNGQVSAVVAAAWRLLTVDSQQP